jgi:hypothetical protein
MEANPTDRECGIAPAVVLPHRPSRGSDLYAVHVVQSRFAGTSSTRLHAVNDARTPIREDGADQPFRDHTPFATRHAGPLEGICATVTCTGLVPLGHGPATRGLVGDAYIAQDLHAHLPTTTGTHCHLRWMRLRRARVHAGRWFAAASRVDDPGRSSAPHGMMPAV